MEDTLIEVAKEAPMEKPDETDLPPSRGSTAPLDETGCERLETKSTVPFNPEEDEEDDDLADLDQKEIEEIIEGAGIFKKALEKVKKRPAYNKLLNEFISFHEALCVAANNELPESKRLKQAS